MSIIYKKFSLISALFLLFFIFIPKISFAQEVTQAELEAELKRVEQQIEQYNKDLSKTQTQKAALSRKIADLQKKQKDLSNQIKVTSSQLLDLDGQISVIEDLIKKNLSKQEKLKKEMAVTLREINFIDNNIILALISSEGLSSIFSEVQNYAEVETAFKKAREESRATNAELTAEQNQLEDKKDDVNQLLQIKSIQQRELKGTLGEQSQLLTETKGQEKNYQAMLEDSKKKAAEIRNRIYELFNTGKQITFGQAVEISKWASGLTGVRPAFLLAVLTQESNLGKNVGTCNRAGDPPEKSWKVIMKPTRDQKPFLEITKDLGLETDTTPVSCPMRDKKGNQIGWGGAMGPAQFIPSTWMGYKDKVAKLSGKGYADPWDIRDAFLAAAIKLKGDGADGTDNGDWKAAMRYFAGSVNLKYRFYGDNVLAITKKYLADIEGLE